MPLVTAYGKTLDLLSY